MIVGSFLYLFYGTTYIYGFLILNNDALASFVEALGEKVSVVELVAGNSGFQVKAYIKQVKIL